MFGYYVRLTVITWTVYDFFVSHAAPLHVDSNNILLKTLLTVIRESIYCFTLFRLFFKLPLTYVCFLYAFFL